MLTPYQKADLGCRAELFDRIVRTTLAEVKWADARLLQAAKKIPELGKSVRGDVVEVVGFFGRMAEFARLAGHLVKVYRAAAEGRDADVEGLLQQLAAEPDATPTFRRAPKGDAEEG